MLAGTPSPPTRTCNGRASGRSMPSMRWPGCLSATARLPRLPGQRVLEQGILYLARQLARICLLRVHRRLVQRSGGSSVF